MFNNVCQCLFSQCLTMSVFDGCLTMIVQLVFVNVVSCVCSSRQSLFDNVQSVFDGCLSMWFLVCSSRQCLTMFVQSVFYNVCV